MAQACPSGRVGLALTTLAGKGFKVDGEIRKSLGGGGRFGGEKFLNKEHC